jgi:hypothetical protein
MALSIVFPYVNWFREILYLLLRLKKHTHPRRILAWALRLRSEQAKVEGRE